MCLSNFSSSLVDLYDSSISMDILTPLMFLLVRVCLVCNLTKIQWMRRAANAYLCMCILVCNSLTKKVWSVPLYDPTKDQVKMHIEKPLFRPQQGERDWWKMAPCGMSWSVCLQGNRALSPALFSCLFPLSDRVFLGTRRMSRRKRAGRMASVR